MEISNRLRIIAELVRYPRMADIGTDHGYVPIWLFQQGRLEKGIACDIHKGPLERANENILQAGASRAIETRRGDGLSPLFKGEVDSIVIAGMGGMLIVEILRQGRCVVSQLQEMVLSPHLDVPEVRKYITQIGFLITEEHMLKEDGKYYTVMRAVPGCQRYALEVEYAYGKLLLERKDPILKEYLKKEMERLQGLSERLSNETAVRAQERLLEVAAEQKKLQEVLKWL